MRLLSFGYDADLLRSDDGLNEGQKRQIRYCEWLGQERTLVVMAREATGGDRVLGGGALRVRNAGARSRWRALWKACACGLEEARRAKPDAVEYQDPQLAGLAAFWVAGRLGVPLLGAVFTDFLSNRRWYGGSPIRSIFNRAGLAVMRRTRQLRCDSPEVAEALRSRGVPSVRYVPFYVPGLEDLSPSSDDLAARRARWKGGPIVLCAARLVPEKNVALLLRAFASLPAGPRLVVLGRGPEEAPLKALAEKLGIAPRVEWPGFVAFEDFARRFREAHVFALPSDFESTARVLVQAQAARLPTVTTATAGSARLVRDGTTGFVTPVGDAAAFARALKTLTSEEETNARFAAAGREAVLAEYREPVLRAALMDFYRDGLRKKETK